MSQNKNSSSHVTNTIWRTDNTNSVFKHRNQSEKPVFPIATAIWLIRNSNLTFKQIGRFCGILELEVKGIADGEVAEGISGLDPISNGQLTKQEIERCSKDPNAHLTLSASSAHGLISKKKQTKYTPIARRQDKPSAIYWLLKNYPNISEKLIIKLIGTTKLTINSIRERTHWNMKNIAPRDPVLLGICSQVELDRVTETIKPSSSIKSNDDI